MNQKVEIRSNILGDILKIRKGVVYKNYETVIDELFQNCQRSSADKIDVSLGEGTLIIRDDGVGCLDPQAVFEKNTTAWLGEEEAFGEGFFSLFLIADYMKVRSMGWELEVDVLEIMKTGNMNLEAVKTDDFISGFEVVLHGELVREKEPYLNLEIKELGRIMPQTVTLNNIPIEKRDLLTPPEDKFSVLVDNPLYQAVLTPEARFSVIQLYYENRPVDSHYKSGVGGNLHFKKGSVTPKAPDRKSLVYDDNYHAFVKQLTDDTQDMYRKFIQQATDEEIDKFAHEIPDHVPVEDYLSLLTVDETLFDLLRYTHNETTEEEIQEVSQQNVEGFSETVKDIEVAEITSRPANAEPGRIENTSHKPYGTRKARLVDVLRKDKQVAWISPSQIETHTYLIADAEQYGFRVIVAKNKLYEHAFEHLNIPHVETLEDGIEKDFSIENIEPQTKKERRFLSLMRIVEKELSLPENSILLADIEVHVGIRHGDEQITTKVLPACGCYSGADHKIYLNRNLIDFGGYRAQAPDYPNTTAHDYRVLMQVQDTLAHELGHMMYGTLDNTKFQNEVNSELSRRLAKIF